MKLYVCWSTNGGDHHGCAKAYWALQEAGYEPEVQKAKGSGYLPGFLQTKLRKEMHQLTGSYKAPVLVLDDGTAISTSGEIAAWAKSHPTNEALLPKKIRY